jgi:hypothetical protein
MSDKWIFKGELVALNTGRAEITANLDLGFGVKQDFTLRLYGVEAPMAQIEKESATAWLSKNVGSPVSVEVIKRNGQYCATIEAMNGPMVGLSLNMQIELAGSIDIAS